MAGLLDPHDSYRQKAQAKVENFQAKIDLLKAKVKEASADAKISLEDKIRDLQDNLDTGRAQLREMQDDRESDWERVKDKIEGIFQGIEDKLQRP